MINLERILAIFSLGKEVVAKPSQGTPYFILCSASAFSIMYLPFIDISFDVWMFVFLLHLVFFIYFSFKSYLEPIVPDSFIQEHKIYIRVIMGASCILTITIHEDEVLFSQLLYPNMIILVLFIAGIAIFINQNIYQIFIISFSLFISYHGFILLSSRNFSFSNENCKSIEKLSGSLPSLTSYSSEYSYVDYKNLYNNYLHLTYDSLSESDFIHEYAKGIFEKGTNIARVRDLANNKYVLKYDFDEISCIINDSSKKYKIYNRDIINSISNNIDNSVNFSDINLFSKNITDTSIIINIKNVKLFKSKFLPLLRNFYIEKIYSLSGKSIIDMIAKDDMAKNFFKSKINEDYNYTSIIERIKLVVNNSKNDNLYLKCISCIESYEFKKSFKYVEFQITTMFLYVFSFGFFAVSVYLNTFKNSGASID